MTQEHRTTSMVRIYQLTLAEAAAIIQRKYPLTEQELLQMRPLEEYDFVTFFEQIRPNRHRNFDAAALTGENPVSVPLPHEIDKLIFPGQVRAPEAFCFCSGLVWEIVPGEPGEPARLVLRCEYFCIALTSFP